MNITSAAFVFLVMANLVQAVGVSLNRALEELGARPAKAGKATSQARASGAASQNVDGLSESSRANVEEMLKAGMGAVATVVETRITTVESSVTELAGKSNELEVKMMKMEEALARQNADIEALRASLAKHEAWCAEKFATLDKRQAEQAGILDKIVVPTPTGNGSSTTPPTHLASPNVPVNANADIPYEQRTVAKIGGFAFDTPAAEMCDFAKAKLEVAGVNADNYSNLHSPHAKGSWLLLTFSTAKALQDARMTFQARKFESNGRKIWLDAAKTRAELRPARLIHRAFTAISDQEKDKTDTMDVEKNLKGKQVKVGQEVAAYTLNSELKWTTFARQRYGEETCDVLRAWVESE